MRREYYNYIKENVKNNLNKKLLNEVLVDDPIEYNIPPREWRRRYAPFANENPATNQPMFSDPPKPTPPQAPVDRGTFDRPTPNSFPVIYREEPPGSGQYYKYRLVNHPQLGWGYQRVPVPAGGAGFTWGENLPVGIIIWNEDEVQFQKYTRPTGWDWIQDLPNFRQNAPTYTAPSLPRPRR